MLDEIVALARTYHRRPVADQTDCRFAIQPLTGGMNNAVYRVSILDRQLCVKLYKVDQRRRTEREWQALTMLAARGLMVAPQPLHFAPDTLLPAVVMEYLPDRPLNSHPIGERELAALAETLQELYALTPAVLD